MRTEQPTLPAVERTTDLFKSDLEAAVLAEREVCAEVCDAKTAKADYVRSQRQTRNHHCHWPGCEVQVPPAMWGCKGHWFTLPASLRARVWATYKPGQEVNGTPSEAYLAVARSVQAWIAEQNKAAI